MKFFKDKLKKKNKPDETLEIILEINSDRKRDTKSNIIIKAKLFSLAFLFWGVVGAQSNNQLIMPTPQEVLSDRPYVLSGKMYFAFYARQVDDALSKSNQGVAVINPDLEVKYGSYLTLGLDLVGLFGTGNASNFWNDDGKAPNTIILSEAFAKVHPHENIFLKVGAIETTINPISSIMSAMTFIGAQQEWQIGAKKSNITLTAFQAIPSSGTVSRRIYEENSQAYFLSQTISGRLKNEPTGSEIKLAATRFQFENLSSNVANDSSLLGNSLSAFEGTAKAYRFKHGFMGTELGGSLAQEIGPAEVAFRGSQIINDQAPAGKNQGRQYGFNIKYTQGNIIVKPGFTAFNYQADVTPAAYTLVTSRYQNRHGHKINMDIELIKEKLALRTYYLNLQENDENPYLADREIYNILMEAKYDLF